MKTQTAVEWLQEALSIHLTFDQKVQFEGLFQQAIAMEKEQMSSCYTEGFKRAAYIRDLMSQHLDDWNEGIPEDFETYYDKTYGNL